MFAFSIMLPGNFCSTNVEVDEPFLKDGSQTVLHVESLGHALHAYINGKLAGEVDEPFLKAVASTCISWRRFFFLHIFVYLLFLPLLEVDPLFLPSNLLVMDTYYIKRNSLPERYYYIGILS